jgi:hemerythrin superfamily protein
MNAIDLLKKQHRKVELILKRLETAKSGQQAMVTDLATVLTAHLRIEEEIFYPVARRVGKQKNGSIVLELSEEHAVVTLELERLMKSGVTDPMFKARVAVITELVMNHFNKEEEEVFPAIQKLVEKRVLERIGNQLVAKFDETVEQGYRKALQIEKRVTAVRAIRAAQARRA